MQLLYSRLISDFWDLQVGLRHDFRPEPERGYVVLGFQGLAPYWFDVDASAFISNQGDVSARFKAEYDLLLTQKLVLSPSLELNLAAQTDSERGIGDGVNDLELSLSLRYEVIREFAPYIGGLATEIRPNRRFRPRRRRGRRAYRRHGRNQVLVLMSGAPEAFRITAGTPVCLCKITLLWKEKTR